VSKDVAVVLLTWKRLPALKNTLNKLSNQTYSDFDLYISNSNYSERRYVEDVAKSFNGRMDIWVSQDSNDYFAFRRLFVGRYLAENKYKKILFLDDDISFPSTYLENALSQWQPKTYKSGYAWSITGNDYHKNRKRVWSDKHKVKYCGSGISMVDARLFLEDDLVYNYPTGALKIEDLWMSYYVDHKLKRKGWKLKYMETPNVVIGGADRVALFRSVKKDSYDKTDLLLELINMGWRI